MGAARPPKALAEGVERTVGRLTARLGSPARRRAIVLLAAVLSLSSADTGTIGALASQLEATFRIDNTRIGLLLAVTSLLGACATLPMGTLVDRVPRVRLLSIAIVVWGLAMVATGLAFSYTFLLLTRLALGIVLAAAGPAVASLTGDLFPAGERTRIFGYVLTGELVGTGAGLVVVGDLGDALGWRVSFFVLAPLSLGLAAALHRLLPEPPRGNQARLGARAARADAEALAERASDEDGVDTEDHLVLRGDPARINLWQAARYILRIPSNRALIASSALGYFFLAGLQTFAVLFARGHFHVSQAAVSGLLLVVGAGSVAGTLSSGRLAERLIGAGRLDARPLLAGAAFVAAAVFLAGGIVSTSLAISLPVLVVAGGLLAATNPPLDAARLDVVPAALWGRGEAVRTFVRGLLGAAAPLLFGYVSAEAGGGRPPVSTQGGVGAAHAHVTAAGTRGLEIAFLIMLAPLTASGVVLVLSRRRYLRDLVTAAESDQVQRRRARAVPTLRAPHGGPVAGPVLLPGHAPPPAPDRPWR